MDRFNLVHVPYNGNMMELDATGEYVRFEDVQALVAALVNSLSTVLMEPAGNGGIMATVSIIETSRGWLDTESDRTFNSVSAAIATIRAQDLLRHDGVVTVISWLPTTPGGAIAVRTLAKRQSLPQLV